MAAEVTVENFTLDATFDLPQLFPTSATAYTSSNNVITPLGHLISHTCSLLASKLLHTTNNNMFGTESVITEVSSLGLILRHVYFTGTVVKF